MPLFIGSLGIDKFYHQSKPITAIYLGAEQVWPNVPGTRLDLQPMALGGGDLQLAPDVVMFLDLQVMELSGDDLATFVGGVAELDLQPLILGGGELTGQELYTTLDLQPLALAGGPISVGPPDTEDIILLAGDAQATGSDGIAFAGDEAPGVVLVAWPVAALDLQPMTLSQHELETTELTAILLAGDEQTGSDVIALAGDEAPGNLLVRP